MPRIMVTVSEEMDKVLKAQSKETNAPVAALVRQAIEEWAQRRGIDLEDDVEWGGNRPQSPGNEQESGDRLAVALQG